MIAVVVVEAAGIPGPKNGLSTPRTWVTQHSWNGKLASFRNELEFSLQFIAPKSMILRG
jgi:hypothetical protein